MKHCKKCGAKVDPDGVFCTECGEKITTKKVKQKKTKEKTKKEEVGLKEKTINKWIYIGGAVVILAILFVFAFPMPYTATEVYSESEPYTDTENYYESESYTTEECDSEDYNSRIGWFYREGSLRRWVINAIENVQMEGYQDYYIQNYEDKAGYFKVYIKYYDNYNNYMSQVYASSNQVGADETQHGLVPNSAIWNNRPTGASGFILGYQPPSKEVCQTVTKFRDVPKTRSVTKYKIVDKERKVTRYASLFKQWTGQVNWHFREGEA